MPVSTGISFPTGGQHMCFPVSKFQTSQFASGFGTFAERLIENDYCETLGCTPATVYQDNNNATAYRAFLVGHNPSLAVPPKAAILAGKFPTYPAPTLCATMGANRLLRNKGDVDLGRGRGQSEDSQHCGFKSDLGLPYVPGTTYTPSKDIPIMSGTMLGCNLGVSLNVQRYVPGVLSYSICLTGEITALLLKASLAAVLAYIAAVLLPMVAAPLFA